MTYAANVALISAGIAFYVAALAVQLSRAPGWEDQRHFALASLAAGAFAALNVPTVAPILSDAAVVRLTGVQLGLVALHVYAWLRYSGVHVGRAPSRAGRWRAALLVAIAAGALVPGLFYTGEVRVHAVPVLAYAARTPVATPLGAAAYAAVLAMVLVPVSRFAGAWRRGLPNAGLQVLALGFLLLLAVNDLLVFEGVYPAPYLSDVAFLLPIATVGSVLTSRFVAAARAHEALRRDLEGQVAQRTAELGRTQEALHRAEKLAALGQFSAGVAHEVNNPSAVVNANLAYLADNEEGLSRAARDAVAESQTAMRRIAMIVRQLLDAGRLAASPESRSSVGLRRVVEGAFSVARARLGRRVGLTNLVAHDAQVLAGEGVLSQVVANLVVNGVQAIPAHRAGQVVARAERTGDRVRLVVEDDGEGMTPDVLRRVFEPFFTTKPFGVGNGLGLAVSRGLVASLGGDLRLESVPGRGTRAIVELAAAPPERRTPAPPTARSAGGGLRLLVVDDEETVLSALRRLLAPRYGVELAPDVDGGLARLQAERFDVVLCDVMMPGGGGERLYRTVLAREPEVARRFVFLTGGAVTDAARSFLREQPQPVLLKPLDLDALAAAADQIGGPHPRSEH